MRPLMRLISALFLCTNNKVAAAADFSRAAGRSLHADDGNFSPADQGEQEAFHDQQQVLDPLPGSVFNLKVHVDDVLSRQSLGQAVVEVYINSTRFSSALTGEDGTVLLHVPDHADLLVTLVACKDGYVCSLLPCRTSRMPIFSSVTVSLQARNQGNVWLFEDSVLITGKTSDALSQSVVQFPKSQLNLTEIGHVTVFKAFLTIPQLSLDNVDALSTLGIMSSKSGFVSVELSPVAAVSVQLFSGDTELHISGSIQISLSVPDSCGLQISTVVPAWFFNRTTGGWMRKGLGKVVSRDGRLVWTFTAPHLGDWIAAPLSSSTRGFFEIAIPADFILHHSSFLMMLLGGVILILVFLLVGLFYCRRCSLGRAEAKMTLPMLKKDQTTSTCEDRVFEASSMDEWQTQDELKQSFPEKEDNRHNSSLHRGSKIENPNDVALTLECTEQKLRSGSIDVTCLHTTTEQTRVPASLAGNLFLYNQPVAILHAPAFFHLEEEEEHPQWSKSATLPRAGASNSPASEPLSKDGFTQMLPKGPTLTQNTEMETEDQKGATAPDTSVGHFSLPESVSVPGTLNKVRDSRRSLRAFGELSEMSCPQPPRAWFVSLEGKPAAEIHYAVSEQQRRRRPAESRETSLDSGVDMNELNPSSGRRAAPLERSATFVKSPSSSKHAD